ncbi:hypothetical protein [Brevibacillus nitrificans]|uniref:hypothetical protein n=1 Tax=Brevibacillus nitrificans TaxID=651560 RepID=UPI002861FCA9|nr:hypothetical protein [Brevibacillus nitrificans]MDR7316047.1 hypothetical protein [Brevibacillus nitrificans]
MKWEIIVKVAGEGGSICLYGWKQKDGTWVYTRENDERTLADMLNQEDYETLKGSVHHFSSIVQDWNQATSMLGRNWLRLLPRCVHPDFSEKIWEIIRTSDVVPSHRLRNWAKLCFSNQDEMVKRLNQANQ